MVDPNSDYNVERKLEIQFAERPGFEGVEDSFRSPVVYVGMGYDPQCNFAKYPPFDPKLVQGISVLLDTGADEMMVDEDLLDSVGAPFVAETSTIKTMHGVEEIKRRKMLLVIKELGIAEECEVVPMKISDGTRAYSAIFGMKFIGLGRLILDMQGDSFFILRLSNVARHL